MTKAIDEFNLILNKQSATLKAHALRLAFVENFNNEFGPIPLLKDTDAAHLLRITNTINMAIQHL